MVTVDVTTSTGECVAGTKVELMEIATSKVLQTIIMDSTSECLCEFVLPEVSFEKYCVNVVAASGYTCKTSCTTPVTGSHTTIDANLVVKTHATSDDADQEVTTSTSGNILVNLFVDENGTAVNLTNLKVTLKDVGKHDIKEITSECEDQAFRVLDAGTYFVVAQQAVGFTCNCEKMITLDAGETIEVDFEYFRE